MPTRNSLPVKDTHRLKVKKWKKIWHMKENQKHAEEDNIKIKLKTVKREKEGCCVIMRE